MLQLTYWPLCSQGYCLLDLAIERRAFELLKSKPTDHVRSLISSLSFLSMHVIYHVKADEHDYTASLCRLLERNDCAP